MSIYMIIRLYFVKICKIVCFQHNVQEFVVLYFAHFMDYQNSFDNFCQEGPQMLHAQFGANWSNCLGGVRKSRFFICREFANGKLLRKWAGPTPHNSAELREHVDVRLTLCDILCGIYGLKTLLH